MPLGAPTCEISRANWTAKRNALLGAIMDLMFWMKENEVKDNACK